MEPGNAVVGALILIALVLGANLVMFVIARNWARGGDSRWMSELKKGLNKPFEPRDKSMDELRQKMEELQKKDKKED